MVDIKMLLPELKKLVADLSEDLLKRVGENAEINAGLENAYKQIEKGGRTAQAYEVWLEDYLDQVAVAWVLSCVFVRFMEDNGLIEECYLAGDGDRRTKAENEHELYFREHPHDSDREYFEHVFREVGMIPACRDLFAEGKTPLWAVGPSGDAAMKLLGFWREIDAEGGSLVRSFMAKEGDTRFLGDLYQELSERARDKYALLQTPEFVEEFILDRTFSPAVSAFGIENLRLIDPTCGSGHFLLGTFSRLFDLWSKKQDNEIVAAQLALDGVWGVDVNPFAVAIARFRLIVTASHACGIGTLRNAPGWNIHLAVGDSLLFGSRWTKSGKKRPEQGWLGENENWAPEVYACEDKQALADVLGQRYHVVVGNPPYITVKDKKLNSAYRDRYSTCHRQYSLVVPFMERFFDLALRDADTAVGFVGLIAANSFMKRNFGKKLVEKFLPTVDLTHVVDTSVAFIPEHTTSTVILFGRNQPPIQDNIRAVLGIKGEASDASDPPNGKAWLSIVRHIDEIGYGDDYVSVADVSRKAFSRHPWSIGGGGAAELKDVLEDSAGQRLSETGADIGFIIITGEDNCLLLGKTCAHRQRLPHVIEAVDGDGVRNWGISTERIALWPNDRNGNPLKTEELSNHLKFCWPYRTNLKHRKAFGVPVEEKGIPWWGLREVYGQRLRDPRFISFAEIATHNHFSFNRNFQAFTQSVPVVKLPDATPDEEYFKILGVLNSSTVCFWAKQVMACKGLGGQGGGIKPEHWSRAYVFNGTTLKQCPLPKQYGNCGSIARAICQLVDRVEDHSPRSVICEGVKNLASRLDHARGEYELAHRKMVSLQERLDWHVYELFGLCEQRQSNLDRELELHPENRPVEVLLKQKMEAGEGSIFYEVHQYRGCGDNEQEMTAFQKAEQADHLRQIATNSQIRLIEHQDFKRRWQVEPWGKQQERALRHWLLQRLENAKCWKSRPDGTLRLTTVAELTDVASGDQHFRDVAAVFRDRLDYDMAGLVSELVANESVPLLPVLRYKESGLRNFRIWDRTWKMQRSEDAGDHNGTIPPAPKYKSADFQSIYWRLRGRLDVPQERWVSFPHCEREGDPSLVIGWAGWDHLQQATAIVAYYDARKREGWTAERLKPLLAGLDQLLPWIHQWHPEIEPEYNETAGTSFQTLLESEAQELGLTLEDIRNWTPPKKKSTRRAKEKA